MKSYEVLALQNDGELVCWSCMTPVEHRCACDKKEKFSGEFDNMSPCFADEFDGEEICSRCNEVIEGTESYGDEDEA